MLINQDSLDNRAEELKAAGVVLPGYDVRAMREQTLKAPVWIHFGGGNIYYAFIAALQQKLLRDRLQTAGIITLSARSRETHDLVLAPHDNLEMAVTMLPDGRLDLELIASSAYDLLLTGDSPADEARFMDYAAAGSLQLVTYTITEKGYALRALDGTLTPKVQQDMEAGPDGRHSHAMARTAAFLYRRFQAGCLPLALVSMDNCSHNGEKMRAAVIEIAREWVRRGLADPAFCAYLERDREVTFPNTMIDKIVPRPDPAVAEHLRTLKLEGMDPVKTSVGTYIAPFVNSEKPGYLVIEDRFPNGRPPLEQAGVRFTDARGVDLCERMKVTACLNPLHTAMSVYGCLLGYDRIFKEMEDPQIVALVKKLGYDEGLPVVEDPGILSPREFLDEVVSQRLTNRCLPDAPQRIATDTSQKVPVRFGETIKSYLAKGLSVENLVALPLGIAGWLRYLLGVDDQGREMELSADPQLETLRGQLAGVKFGEPESVGDNLRPILENALLFGTDLYKAGLAGKVTEYFCELIAGPGAVRATLKKYLGQ